MQRKKITIPKKESEKTYMDDFKTIVSEKKEEKQFVRKSFVISESLNYRLEQYIRKKRMGGETDYTQTDLIREILDRFFTDN